MSLTFKTIQGERTSAVYLNAVTGPKAMTVLFKFFKDGYVRENNMEQYEEYVRVDDMLHEFKLLV